MGAEQAPSFLEHVAGGLHLLRAVADEASLPVHQLHDLFEDRVGLFPAEQGREIGDVVLVLLRGAQAAGEEERIDEDRVGDVSEAVAEVLRPVAVHIDVDVAGHRGHFVEGPRPALHEIVGIFQFLILREAGHQGFVKSR